MAFSTSCLKLTRKKMYLLPLFLQMADNILMRGQRCGERYSSQISIKYAIKISWILFHSSLPLNICQLSIYFENRLEFTIQKGWMRPRGNETRSKQKTNGKEFNRIIHNMIYPKEKLKTFLITKTSFLGSEFFQKELEKGTNI